VVSQVLVARDATPPARLADLNNHRALCR
jgi:hypothetical protein